MEVDYTGTQTVAEVIKETGLNKFIIYKYGNNRNSVPVLNFDSGGSPNSAIEFFKNWAKLANNNNCYDMILYKGDFDQEENEPNKPGKKKEKQIRFTFRLKGSGIQNDSADNGYSNYGNAPIGLIMENASLKAEQKLTTYMFQHQMDELKKKMEELENDDEDDDEDELAGLGKSVWAERLVDHLIEKDKRSSVAINGPDETNTQQQVKVLTKEQVDKIKTAVSILSQHDDKIDDDLLKLAAIAQKKPDTFKMLLNTLRTM